MKALMRRLLGVYLSPLPAKRRGGLFRSALRLSMPAGASRTGTITGRILDYDVTAYSHEALLLLFDEIFVNAQYRFETEAARPVIIDCGSNIGVSILFFKALYPSAKVTGFEPSSTAFALLQSNVTQNHLSDVTVHQLALGANDGTIEFYFDPKNPGSLTMTTVAERLSSGHTTVTQARLSRFIEEPVDFLKLDVEGAEHGVLNDLVSSGKIQLIKQMGIEYHHHIKEGVDELSSFLQLLESSGFGYQIASSSGFALQGNRPGEFQDLLLHAYRKN